MILTVEKEVEAILRKYPDTRDSDELLYQVYLARHQITTVSVASFFSNFGSYNVAKFETIRRTRQKLQEHNEDLRPSEYVRQQREEQQQLFLDYVRGNR